jgi:phenylpyruvate tautomerase PptA (4-oxalocrotonate tautomerase family)
MEVTMPMIQAKVTMQLPAEKRDILKAEFGKAISIMGKPESYLMISLEDNQDLYFGGKKLDKGAYVEVKVLGNVDASASDKMTAKICEILKAQLDIPGNAIYVSYFGTSNWGWNGGNF